MTQPQMVQVDAAELLARADELESQIPSPPVGNPQAPCALSMVTDAAKQLAFSADSLRLYLAVGERERRRLAESLRNAAKAYDDVDQAAADAVQSGVRLEGPKMPSPGGDSDLSAQLLLHAEHAPMLKGGDGTYCECKRAAQDLARPDQGVAFKRFADDWRAYQRTLLQANVRFRPFQQWDGDARLAVEANFDQQRSWMFQMAELCAQVAKQAEDVASAHHWAVSEHPPLDNIEYTESEIRFATEANDQPMLKLSLEWYAGLQQKSEDTLAGYAQKGSLPLQAVNPPTPPTAYHIDPPSDEPAVDPEAVDINGLPSAGDAGMPQLPSGIPAAGAGAGGKPETPMPDAAALTGAKPGSPSAPKSGVKPASFGGAGAGIGMPKMPLQPATGQGVDPQSAAKPPVPKGYAVNLPGANQAGAMGGGMGGAPLGQGGQQNQSKAKRLGQEDGSLYTEDRAWTEGVIVNRVAKPANAKPASAKSA